MNNHNLKLGSTPQNGTPFICRNKPLVCLNHTVILPLVCKKLPFVWNRGFTLIELVVTMTVAGILLAIAAPPMAQFVGQNRLSANTNDLIADINLARSEAIKRSARAGICVSLDGATCGAGNWTSGWLVYYIDPTTNALTPVRAHDGLTGNNNTFTAAATGIQFSKAGAIEFGSGDYQLCDTKLKRLRRINISTTGRPTLTTPSPDTC